MVQLGVYTIYRLVYLRISDSGREKGVRVTSVLVLSDLICQKKQVVQQNTE